MNWQTLIDPQLCGRLCLTLAHSLWQVSLLAAAGWGIERLWCRRRIDRSYALYTAALVSSLLALPLTFVLLGSQLTSRPAEVAQGQAGVSSGEIVSKQRSQQPAGVTLQLSASADESKPLANDGLSNGIAAVGTVRAIDWNALVPWVVAAYLSGVGFMLLRLGAGIFGAHRLAASASEVADRRLVAYTRRLAAKWSMRVVPVLAIAERVVVPKVVGLVRPTILLPAAAMNGLSIAELEMVLAHELAHVKRCDMWVNLFQRLAEAVLFFNPALWFLSRRIGAVREFCCDELTCGAIADTRRDPRTEYACALLHVVELSQRAVIAGKSGGNVAALAASGRSPSELRRRVARLFGEPLREPLRVSRGGLLTLAALAAFVVLGPFAWKSPVNSAEEKPVKSEPVHIPIVVAKHVMLLDGKQIVTWKDIEALITAMPHPELAEPSLYVTRGAREEGKEPIVDDEISKIHDKFHLNGHSMGSLWPRADFRYDAIETSADLTPDESLRFEGAVLGKDNKPVSGAEVVLVTPVDKSISYTTYHIAIVAGRLRNPLEDVNTKSDGAGKFVLYPPKDVPYYIVAMHPEVGFALVRSDQIDKDHAFHLLAWGGLKSKFAKEEGKQQEASLRGSVKADGEWPEISIDQYWSDLKEKPTLDFHFTHIPPLMNTGISRDISGADGGSIGVNAASINLLPGETRSMDFGPLSEQQIDQIKAIQELSGVRKKGAAAKPKSAEFDLKIVGPDGKPVPQCEVKIRIQPRLTADTIMHGQLVSNTNDSKVKAGDDGRIVFKLSKKRPPLLGIFVEFPGYAPYYAQWNSYEHPEPIPNELVAELDAGWIVGGVVVDKDGKPVEGASVNPSITFKKRPGDHDELWIGTEVKTAADGSWQYGCVPAAMNGVGVTLNHAKFMPEHRSLSRGEYELTAGAKPAARIELKPGLTARGTITDEAGKPVAGALIRTQFVNDIREAKSGVDGKYELGGGQPGPARIVVSAKGKALDMQDVDFRDDMAPVDFVMKPGGHLRVVALDESGKPIPKTRIFFQQWRGQQIHYFEFDHISDYANDKGVWEWNEAPLDEIKADICRPGGMQLSRRSLKARAEEYVFHSPKMLVVSGSVVDAKTKQPIKKFQVYPGLRGRDDQSMQWLRNDGYEAKNGKYQMKQGREYKGLGVRIEAVGYKAGVSRELKFNEGNVTIDFALEPGENVAATVLAPDGKPAAKAKVALGVAGSQIQIENGDIADGSTYHAARLDTDNEGRITFPPQDGKFQIVITHPAGFASIAATPDHAPTTIQLTPWAKVEGVFRAGTKAEANVNLDLNGSAISSYGENEPHIFESHRTTTGPGGKFEFNRVFPGRAWMGRQIIFMVDSGAREVASQKMVPLEAVAGETTHRDIGGDGRAVVGKLEPAEGVQPPVAWNQMSLHLRVDLPQPKNPNIPAAVRNDQKKYDAWWKAWQLTPEGVAWKGMVDANRRLEENSPMFTVTVDRDGSFRIDDVPPGNYLLNTERFGKAAAGTLTGYKLSIPDGGGDPSLEPLDLGNLKLQR